MIKDYRRSEPANLNTQFRNYRQANKLAAWYQFNKQSLKSWTTAGVSYNGFLDQSQNNAPPSLYASALNSDYYSSKMSPFVGFYDFYSADFDYTRQQNFEIPYNGSYNTSWQTYNPSISTGDGLTVSCWVKIPSLRPAQPDSESYIWTRLRELDTSAWTDEGILYLKYNGADKTFMLGMNCVDGDGTMTLNTYPIDLDRGDYKAVGGGEWVYITAVIKSPPSGNLGGKDVKTYSFIYINGQDMSSTASAASFISSLVAPTANSGWLIGKGRDDNSTSTNWADMQLYDWEAWEVNLEQEEIFSLYESAVLFSGTGIISQQPRVLTQQLDNLPGRYPTIKRPATNSERLGLRTPFFDDMTTQIFSRRGQVKHVSSSFGYYNLTGSFWGPTKEIKYENDGTLVLWYKMDEAIVWVAGNTYPDYSGRGNDGTIIGNPGGGRVPLVKPGAPNISDWALGFAVAAGQGTANDYGGISTPTCGTLGIDAGNSWSFSTWFKVDDDNVNTYGEFDSNTVLFGTQTTGYINRMHWRFERDGEFEIISYDGSSIIEIYKTPLSRYDGSTPAGSSAATSNTFYIDDRWHHLAFTWDATVLSGSVFYDGMNVGHPDAALGAKWMATMASGDFPCIGADLDTATEADQGFEGSICHFAIWSKVLSHNEIKAQYNQMHRGTGIALFNKGTVSGNPGIDFVNYPTMLHANDGPYQGIPRTKWGQISSASHVTPNTLSTLTAPGYSPGYIVGDYIDVASASLTDFSDSYTPFDESQSTLGDSAFFNTGSLIMPGFETSLKNKVAIEIDLTSGKDSYMTRTYSIGARGFGADQDGGFIAGEFPGQVLTGMFYWNKDMLAWNPIGGYDRVTNKLTYSYGLCKINDSDTDFGDDPYTASLPSQFHQPGLGWWGYKYLSLYVNQGGFDIYASSSATLPDSINPGPLGAWDPPRYKQWLIDAWMRSIPYRNIGMPQMLNAAPNGIIYHATSSEQIDLSEYINGPFLLEKIRLDVPVYVRRKYDAHPEGENGSQRYLEQNPADAYTFFIYKQTSASTHQAPGEPATNRAAGFAKQKGSRGDEKMKWEVSGSDRELIAFSSAIFMNDVVTGSFAAYGTNRSTGDTNGGIWWYPGEMTSDQATLNYSASLFAESPAVDFVHNFGVTAAEMITGRTAIYTGSLELEFTPKIVGPSAIGNAFRFALAGHDGTPIGISLPLLNYWAGGSRMGSIAQWFAPPSFIDATPENYFIIQGQKPHTTSQNMTLDLGIKAGYARPLGSVWPIMDAVNNLYGQGFTDEGLDINIRGGSLNAGAAPNFGSSHFPNVTGNPHKQYGMTYIISGSKNVAANAYNSGESLGLYLTIAAPQVADSVTSVALLNPEDKLILGFEAAPPDPTFFPNDYDSAGGQDLYFAINSMTASYMRINQGPAKVTLYGSYLKNGQPYYPSVNQQLTSDALHEVVSSGPVLDQYETAFSMQYSGSMRASYMTGSVTTPKTGNPRFPILKEENYRKVVAGLGNVPKIYTWAEGTGVVRSQPSAGDMASLQRNFRAVDSHEIYLDSCPPKVEDIWDADSADVYSPDGATPDAVYYYYGFFTEGYGTNWAKNNNWVSAFPFEPRYAGVRRLLRQNANTGSIGTYPSDTAAGSAFLMWKIESVDGTHNAVGYEGGTSSQVGKAQGFLKGVLKKQPEPIEKLAPSDPTSHGIKYGSETAARAYFNDAEAVGFDNRAFLHAIFGLTDNMFNVPDYVFYPAALVGTTAKMARYCFKPRGYRYGLMNATPIGTSAVYRSTHYGQFRDMLEQRQYSRMRSADSGRRIGRPPVKAVFRQPVWEDPTISTGFKVSPIDTQCSNLSIFATSSMPYFDGEVKNRDAPPATEDVEIE